MSQRMAALSAAVIIATAGALAVTTPAQADGCTEMGGVLGFMTSCPNESTPYAAGILCGYGGIPEDKWTMGPWQTYGTFFPYRVARAAHTMPSAAW